MKKLTDLQIKDRQIESQRKSVKFLVVLVIIGMVGTCILGASSFNYMIKYQKSQELLIFGLEELQYCIDNQNITIDEFAREFLTYKSGCLINGGCE
jgi:hypothetical protein